MTAQQKYDDLMRNLSMGLRCPFKDEDDKFIIIMPDKDFNGNFRNSGWFESLEDAKKNIGQASGYSEKDLLELMETCAPLPPSCPEQKIKEKDKVVISENSKETCETFGVCWNEKMEKMIGKKCEIKRVFNDGCTIWRKDKSAPFFFPYGAFYFASGEVEEEVQEMTVADIEKMVGKKVKIIK